MKYNKCAEFQVVHDVTTGALMGGDTFEAPVVPLLRQAGAYLRCHRDCEYHDSPTGMTVGSMQYCEYIGENVRGVWDLASADRPPCIAIASISRHGGG